MKKAVNVYVEASHERCRLKGIRRENIHSTRMLTESELQKKLEENKELIHTAAPFLNHLYEYVKSSNFFGVLADAEGCILSMIGDEAILSQAYELKMVPGAYMDEEHIGTNAISIALTEGVSIQLSAGEHFINAYHKWTCSAAPIRNNRGNIVGVINLTGFCENVHPHTLGMVVAAGNAIESLLEINQYNSELEFSKKRLETIFDLISSGILASDVEGNIITHNKHAVTMFGYSGYELRGKKIWELVKGWNGMLEKLVAGDAFTDENVYVNARTNKLQFTLTAYPIFDSVKRLKEIVYVFYELKKVRKLAGKILGGQAVYTFDKIIGKNRGFLRTVEYAKKIADSKSTVLLTGESGTGKEVFAQSIHNCSIRKDEPFIAVNCGAIPRTLIESELFGYEEGSFTGARKGGNAGKFELADGGTIFLDEIGDMPIDMQIRLLRVIEEGVIIRIGSSRQIPVNVRIIAATNKDLTEEVARGNFRKDLFYRLNVLPIMLPPLRERRDDIPLLIDYYMDKTSKRLNKRRVYISQEYMNYLQSYQWPGNIRELENVIELIVNTEDVQLNLWDRVYEEKFTPEEAEVHLSLSEVEKTHIIHVLKEVNGNMAAAARLLDVGRNTLYRKLEKHHIDCSRMEHCSRKEQA